MLIRASLILTLSWILLYLSLRPSKSQSGCRMAYMHPSYIPHSQYVDSRHSNIYGLYLYHDKRWSVGNEDVSLYHYCYFVKNNTEIIVFNRLIKYQPYLFLETQVHINRQDQLVQNYLNSILVILVNRIKI